MFCSVICSINFQFGDISIATLTVQQLRLPYMDFTYPFYYDYTGGLYRKEIKSNQVWATVMVTKRDNKSKFSIS